MRHLLSACLLTLCSVAHAEVIDIDNAQLEKLIQSGVPVIDIRLQREWEETGIVASQDALKDWRQSNLFEIFAEWRHRYAPGVTHNTEHVFSLEVPATQAIFIAPAEHSNYQWLPWQEAAAKCFSWSNRDAILMLPEKILR